MNATTIPAPRHRPDLFRNALRLVIVPWALFWTWFVLVDGLSDARTLGPETYGWMALFLAGVWVPSVLAWRRPLLGAIAMGAVALAGLVYLRGSTAIALIAGPPLAFALGSAWLAWRERRGPAR